jgi:hypothetical protein
MLRLALRLRALVTVGTLGGGALLLVACSGKVIPGQDGTLQAVALSEIDKPVVSCGGGYAHPNVCCEAGAGKESSCGVYPGAPFEACASGHSTYPDPRSCCPLDGSGDCIAPPPSPSPPPPVTGCSYACAAGGYPLAAFPGTCCIDEGTTMVCTASTTVGCTTPICACSTTCVEGGPCPPPCDCPPEPSCAPPPPPPVCSCPACLEGESCPPCDCGPTPSPTPAPACNACPDGWQVPDGEPLLCCNESSGVIECFSQGVPPVPTPLPATPVHSGGGAGQP